MQVIALPELDERLRKQCLHLLSKICKACEMLPASYILQQEPTRVDNIRCYGGFADVSEGEYLGRRVAIKSLRFGTKDKIFKVLGVPTPIGSSSLSLHLELLPGNYRLEAPVSPQRIAFFGSFCVHRSSVFPYPL